MRIQSAEMERRAIALEEENDARRRKMLKTDKGEGASAEYAGDPDVVVDLRSVGGHQVEELFSSDEDEVGMKDKCEGDLAESTGELGVCAVLGRCGIRGCKNPHMELRDGHRCKACRNHVHPICASDHSPTLCDDEYDDILFCSLACKEGRSLPSVASLSSYDSSTSPDASAISPDGFA
jgi:hypothetical protein